MIEINLFRQVLFQNEYLKKMIINYIPILNKFETGHSIKLMDIDSATVICYMGRINLLEYLLFGLSDETRVYLEEVKGYRCLDFPSIIPLLSFINDYQLYLKIYKKYRFIIHQAKNSISNPISFAIRGGNVEIIKHLQKVVGVPVSKLPENKDTIDFLARNSLDLMLEHEHNYLLTRQPLKLFQSNENIVVRQNSKMNFVDVAVLYGHCQVVDLLLNQLDVPINTYFPFLISIRDNRIDILKTMLDYMEKNNLKTSDILGMDQTISRESFINLSVASGNVELVKLVFTKLPFKNLSFSMLWNSIFKSQSIEVFEYVVGSGLSLSSFPRNNSQLFMGKEDGSPNLEFIKYIWKYSISKQNTSNFTTKEMNYACERGNLPLLELIHQLLLSLEKSGNDAEGASSISVGRVSRYLSASSVSIAAGHGYKSIIQYLQTHFHDVPYECEALDKAASNNKMDMARYLAENTTAPCSAVALNCVAKHGDLDLLKCILENRSIKDGYSTVALNWATASGHHNIVEYLLKSYSNHYKPNTETIKSAISSGNIELLDLLVKHGATINIKDGVDTDQLLQTAVAIPSNLPIVIKLVKQYNIPIDSPALTLAIRNNSFDIVQFLIKHVVNPIPLTPDTFGHCLKEGNYQLFETLDNYYNKDKIGLWGIDVVIGCIKKGNREALQYVLQNIPKSIITDKNINKLLECASSSGYINTLKYLLEWLNQNCRSIMDSIDKNFVLVEPALDKQRYNVIIYLCKYKIIDRNDFKYRGYSFISNYLLDHFTTFQLLVDPNPFKIGTHKSIK